jgi:NAD(P)H-hydrate epimerase
MLLPTLLRRRKPDSHKGDYGHILILAGSKRFSGAGVLCAGAAMRAGAGLVTLALPESINNPVIRIKPREVMTLPLPETKEGTVSLSAYRPMMRFLKDIDVLVIGPGLSQNKSTQQLIRKLAQRAAVQLILDADGLNALSGHLDLLAGKTRVKHGTIVTPHPGEMARLLKTSKPGVKKLRKKVAKTFASNYNSITVLKGHQTVVSDGAQRLYINRTGNPGMATAGSGDVLTGIIAAFLSQGLDSFEAAQYGVYVHGLAGDLAAGSKGQLSLIASDIIDYLPKALQRASRK